MNISDVTGGHFKSMKHIIKSLNSTRQKALHFPLRIVCACMLSPLITLFVILWTVALQAPLFKEFLRQEHWSGLACLLRETFLTQGPHPHLFRSPAWAGGLFTTPSHSRPSPEGSPR